jgi:hypothetical protein
MLIEASKWVGLTANHYRKLYGDSNVNSNRELYFFNTCSLATLLQCCDNSDSDGNGGSDSNVNSNREWYSGINKEYSSADYYELADKARGLLRRAEAIQDAQDLQLKPAIMTLLNHTDIHG